MGLVVFGVSTVALDAQQPTGRYTDAMFRAAIANDTTSPSYLLATIENSRTGTTRLVCVAAPFLEGALQIEFGIGYDPAGERKVRQLIFARKDHVYALSKAKALANVKPSYTPRVLQEVRALLASYSDDEIRHTDLWRKIYWDKDKPDVPIANAYRDATAHVLLERGISCSRQDVTGALGVQ